MKETKIDCALQFINVMEDLRAITTASDSWHWIGYLFNQSSSLLDVESHLHVVATTFNEKEKKWNISLDVGIRELLKQWHSIYLPVNITEMQHIEISIVQYLTRLLSSIILLSNYQMKHVSEVDNCPLHKVRHSFYRTSVISVPLNFILDHECPLSSTFSYSGSKYIILSISRLFC